MQHPEGGKQVTNERDEPFCFPAPSACPCNMFQCLPVPAPVPVPAVPWVAVGGGSGC